MSSPTAGVAEENRKVRQPSRILYIARNISGGSLESLHVLAKNLDRQRFLPTVLFLRPPQDATLRRFAVAQVECIVLAGSMAAAPQRGDVGSAEEPQPGLLERFTVFHGARGRRIHRLLRSLFFLLRRDIPLALRMLRRLRGMKIDLIHINSDVQTGKAGIIFAGARSVPCVCHVRMWHTWTPVEHLLSRWVDKLIYISKAVQKYQTDQGVAPEKGVVVYNAVECSQPDRVAGPRIRAELGWTNAQFVIGSIGRLDWWKGHEYFLLAMRQVVNDHPQARGLIVGGVQPTPKNEAYAAGLAKSKDELGLSAHVVLTGFRNDVPDIMADVDAVVLCSTEPEPFGRVVIEGMAAGKPVIATSAGGVEEIIEHAQTGLLVPARDPRALAAAIGELIDRPAYSAALGAAGLRSVRARFNVRRQLERIQRIYAELL